LASSSAAGQRPPSESAALSEGEAYNGKTLPARHDAVRKVRIRDVAPGARQMEFLDDGADAGPLVKPAENHTWSKVARARQQVIFPVAERKPMPAGN
jgi:hypothetical protein